jgi:protein TonB
VIKRALAIVAAVLAACGAPTPPSPDVAPPPPQATPPPPPQEVATAKTAPGLSPLDRYKHEVAREILRKSAAKTFNGVPPDLLRAVVVLQLTLDGKGAVTAIKTLRTRDAALATVATQSVRAAAPFPPPPRELLRRGQLELAETWLFRDDGRFQVRSLAEAQALARD